MHSRDTLRVLRTIGYNIELARSFLDGMSFDDFHNDERTIYAVTRCLEIISEASRRLPDELKERHPQVPWRRIASSGNVYRHDYEDVLARIIWTTVHEHLGPINDVVKVETD